ncbi:hypothetical protein G4Y79_06230 [Phototrophicus methaneseepsis]|uniref:Uncharacterized protein n=1 Tax=Phototrophicus methaneseepsis TaxID=2710758 RepID=A0A7S8EBU3_9CHLR|nr:hypothetical protein [Phototrophicus methaneseepsis]QPC83974.1 hypothetical protein G4Y79_06230 [Phototrophicus methaneseepsis]
MRQTFYIHEDLWGVVTLTPTENKSQFDEVRAQLAQHDREHWTGSGWNELFFLPDEHFPLARRAIPYSQLFDHFQPAFYGLRLILEGDSLPTGTRAVNEFALHCPDFGTLYGLHRKIDGILTQLHFAEEDEMRLSEAALHLLHGFGQQHRLMLFDGYLRECANLANLQELRQYFEGNLPGPA